MVNLWKLIKLLWYDWRHPEIAHPWGVLAFSGEAGSGKTVSMADYALNVAPNLYPDVELKIFTNFDLIGQTGAITCVGDIVNAPRDSIVLIDETANWFDAHKWAEMPPEMMQPLTQHRHMDVQLIFATQIYKHMNPRIRDLCLNIAECDTWKNRITRQHWYKKSDYTLIENSETEYKRAKCFQKYNFLQTPELRAAYDTKHEVISALLKKQNDAYKINKVTVTQNA